MTAIIVIGMHRSGTSLVSGILHDLGCSMGNALLEADEHNPGGYYEDKVILSLNKSILEAAKGSWNKPPSRKAILNSAIRFRKKYIAHIKLREQESKVWGMKDPRLCLIMEAYHSQINDPRYVFVHRQPASVAASLERLHGPGEWRALIKRYADFVGAFIKIKKPALTTNIYYEQLTSNEAECKATTKHLARFSGIKPTRKSLRACLSKVKLRNEPSENLGLTDWL